MSGASALLALGIGLMLFVFRSVTSDKICQDTWIRFGFWAINIGLMPRVLLSILPVGLAQTVASVTHGLWYARSAEFMQQPLCWLRVIPHLRWHVWPWPDLSPACAVGGRL